MGLPWSNGKPPTDHVHQLRVKGLLVKLVIDIANKRPVERCMAHQALDRPFPNTKDWLLGVATAKDNADSITNINGKRYREVEEELGQRFYLSPGNIFEKVMLGGPDGNTITGIISWGEAAIMPYSEAVRRMYSHYFDGLFNLVEELDQMRGDMPFLKFNGTDLLQRIESASRTYRDRKGMGCTAMDIENFYGTLTKEDIVYGDTLYDADAVDDSVHRFFTPRALTPVADPVADRLYPKAVKRKIENKKVITPRRIGAISERASYHKHLRAPVEIINPKTGRESNKLTFDYKRSWVKAPVFVLVDRCVRSGLVDPSITHPESMPAKRAKWGDPELADDGIVIPGNDIML